MKRLAYSRGRCQLQYWLDQRGYTQAQFAQLIGWSERMVSFWCKNQRLMSVDAMYNASRILKIKMEDLYRWDLIVQ
nr:helix-turn-helix transcriptional regulator [Paenibacillus sp. DMB5]